jgi:hypothetical protein
MGAATFLGNSKTIALTLGELTFDCNKYVPMPTNTKTCKATLAKMARRAIASPKPMLCHKLVMVVP